jgi:hypothetical protein
MLATLSKRKMPDYFDRSEFILRRGANKHPYSLPVR